MSITYLPDLKVAYVNNNKVIKLEIDDVLEEGKSAETDVTNTDASAIQ